MQRVWSMTFPHCTVSVMVEKLPRSAGFQPAGCGRILRPPSIFRRLKAAVTGRQDGGAPLDLRHHRAHDTGVASGDHSGVGRAFGVRCPGTAFVGVAVKAPASRRTPKAARRFDFASFSFSVPGPPTLTRSTAAPFRT